MIDYYIDGHKFRDYGVIVESSKGLLAGLNPKEPVKQDWKDRHGEEVMLSTFCFEARDIDLECTLTAPDMATFLQRVGDFSKLFYTPFKKRLNVGVSTNALVFDVYLREKIDMEKRWRDGQCYAKFTLSLREPEPVKQVYRFTGTSLTLTINTAQRLNVSYGDNAYDNNVLGTKTLTHTYTAAGTYYIIVSGSITNKVTSTNATQIWNNLL